jgi:protease I
MPYEPTTMTRHLEGHRIAFLATDGVEPSELQKPWERLKSEGAQVELISLKPGQIQGMKHFEKAQTFPVDRTIQDVTPDAYDALVLPGGVHNPDRLRTDEAAVDFVRAFFTAGKPVGVICHGAWTLVEAGVVRGRTLTSARSIRTDIENAGGRWVDQEVVVDKGLVSSRKPEDLPAFNDKLVEEIAEGKHEARPMATAGAASR